ncbi:MAG: tRNA glutamyl-Q(34) synthetase GluQRS, partial [Oscillospiraceae bacterium]|nr:tRNA glutamyl-Q(34) synthetase GluQRS [Oscillospiraceae bacterium]
ERSGRRPAWKLRVPDAAVAVEDAHYGAFTQNLARDVGDFIIRRSDGVYAYQLAVSVDDMQMGVTRVVRGRDLLSSAPRQRWLIETLGGAAPVYAHGPLLSAGSGKLSKRLGSRSTQVLRQELHPEALVGRLAFLCGLLDREEPITPRELLPLFSWEHVVRHDVLL